MILIKDAKIKFSVQIVKKNCEYNVIVIYEEKDSKSQIKYFFLDMDTEYQSNLYLYKSKQIV